MTNLSTTPAPARTDGAAAISTDDLARTRRAGLVLAAGAAIWAIASLTLGFNPDGDPELAITDLTGLLFQGGLLALLQVQMRTRATGPKPISRRLLQLERILLIVAMVWSLCHGLLPGQRDAVWMGVLDAFWPLSMLGMFFVGVKVAIAGRWRGPSRLWSLLAETWAPVCVPVFGALGSGVADIVGGVHLLLGYTMLGVILVTRPGLTEGVDR